MNLAKIPTLNNIVCANEAAKLARLKRHRCLTLPEGRVYLDSCATYHSVFMEWILENIHELDTYLTGYCNAGLLTCKEKGYLGLFEMWLRRDRIANLLFIPQLEEDGYEIYYNTNCEWVVTTP